MLGLRPLLVLATPGGHHAEVPLGVTLFFTGILVAMIAALALEEKLHAKKSVITLGFAVVSLFLGSAFHLLPFGAVIDAFGNRITLPVYIGLPGVAPLRKLMSISARIGVGPSIRFLSHHASLLGKLVRPGGYAPDELIRQLTPTIMDPEAAIQGFHIYTFNQVETTEAWRQQMLAELTS